MKLRALALSCALVAALTAAKAASATTIDFEGHSDFDPVGSTYSSLGVTFSSNVYFITPNYLDPNYGPNSGNVAIFTNVSSFTISFTTPVNGASIYYAAPGFDPVTITAYDSLGNILDSETVSSYGSESQQAFSQAGIASIVIDSDPGFAAFDDLSFNTNVSSTPEPSSLILLGTGALGMVGAARRRFIQR